MVVGVDAVADVSVYVGITEAVMLILNMALVLAWNWWWLGCWH